MQLARAIALAALPALLVTGCGGNSTTPSVLSQSQNSGAPHSLSAAVRPFDTSLNDLHAGGATFPALAYNGASQPVGSYTDNQALPVPNSLFATGNYGGSANVYYCLTGSGFGKSTYTGSSTTQATAPCAPLGQTATGFGGRVDPPDFAGSDQALLTTEYGTYLSVREGGTPGNGHGEPFEFPSVTGPIVFPYTQSQFSGLSKTLQLSRWTYCAIANGSVTDWNDPAVTADNGNVSVVGGVSTPITFVYRSDGSGTSYLFQNHLNVVCGSSWPAPYNTAPYEQPGRTALWGRGTSKNWLGPTTGNFVGANGNPGVIAAIQGTTNATGYAEGGYVAQAGLQQANLRNQAGNFESPANPSAVGPAVSSMKTTMGAAPDGTLATTRPECIFYIDPGTFANPTASGAYPIVGVSYLLAYGKGNGTHTGNLKKLFNYVEGSTAATLIKSLEYQPVPTAIRTQVHYAISGAYGTPYYQKPCIKS